MKKIIIILTVLSIAIGTIAITLNSKKTEIMLPKWEKYNIAWEKVDSLESEGLPKSALELVEDIYNKAKNDNNVNQYIKSLFYQLKYKNNIGEITYADLIVDVEKKAEEAVFPTKGILQSILAEMYWTYYQNNRWQIQDRTNVVSEDSIGVETMSTEMLVGKIIEYYTNSLSIKDSLQGTSIKYFEDIIYSGSDSSRVLRPTLYDFLAFRAIDFYTQSDAGITKPLNEFTLEEASYLGNVNDFIGLDIKSNDTLSFTYNAIKLFKEVLIFNKENPKQLFDADLARLKFVHSHSGNDIKDSLYINTLTAMLDIYPADYAQAEIKYTIAKYTFSKVSLYAHDNPTSYIYKNYAVKAHALATEVVEKYPNTHGGDQCGELIKEIEQKALSFIEEKYVPSNSSIPISVTYRNIPDLYCRIASISEKDVKSLHEKCFSGDGYYSEREYKYYNALKEKATVLEELHFSLPGIEDYNTHRTEAVFKGLPLGTYMVYISNNKEFNYEENSCSYIIIKVTDISFTYRNSDDNGTEIFVAHRKTGRPLAGAKIKAHSNTYNSKLRKYENLIVADGETNTEGGFVVPRSDDYRNIEFEVRYNDDILKTSDTYYQYNYYRRDGVKRRIHFYTDREIYRPGQTIYFKGIYIQETNGTPEILKGARIHVDLKDPNYQSKGQQYFTTNEFGSVSGSFVIPTNTLTGNFTINTGYGGKSIKVEEYKRPKFEIETAPLEGNYMLGKQMDVKTFVKAYSGAAISDAKVTYTVTRNYFIGGWYDYYYGNTQKIIARGELETDDKGECTITFLAEPDLSKYNDNKTTYRFSVEISVTDINGETQSITREVTIGNTALNIDVGVNEIMERSARKSVTFSTQNLNGLPVPALLDVNVYKLTDPQKAFIHRKWAKPDEHLYTQQEWYEKNTNLTYAYEDLDPQLEKEKLFLSEKVNTKDKSSLSLDKVKNWKTGKYLVETSATDAFGNEVKHNSYFTIIDPESNKPAYPVHTQIVCLNGKAEPGENVRFLLASVKDVTLLYEIEYNGKIVAKEIINLNSEQKIISIPVKEEYRGNFSVHFTGIAENNSTIYSKLISVPFSNKDLDIEFETFRNKLLPGENEEWKLKIKGAQGEKVAAEMVATLYDKSLDQFVKNDWSFPIYNYSATSCKWASRCFPHNTGKNIEKDFNEYYSFYDISYYSLNWFNFTYYRHYNRAMKSMARAKRGALGYAAIDENSETELIEVMENAAAEEAESDDGVINDPVLSDSITENDAKGKGDKADKEDLSKVKARTNFNETAFFYPHLQTDEEGNVVVSFTIPESLTTWKMKGLAHTQNLEYGLITNELITQKELMVVPNTPRFFREGDKMQMQVKISNVSDKDLTGTASISFFDALSMKPASVISGEAEKPFTVKAGNNIVLNWEVAIPDDVQALTYRAVAKAGKVSDAEENVIPVLSNRMLVTESIPLPVTTKGTKQFTFEKLKTSGNSSTLKHHKVTLEFSSNPAWYAVQSLPYIMEYPHECAEQTFSRYYANSIASYIVNSSPKIKNVFEQWKNSEKSNELLSNLEKNEELKSVMLQETPWLLDAQNESERKQRIAHLFDLNKMSNELTRAFEKIEKAQMYNGAWPWFRGMQSDRYITQHIISGMGHLEKLGVIDIKTNNEVREVVRKGISYLDNQLHDDYKDWLKRKKEYPKAEPYISHFQIHYLYCRSFYLEHFAIDKKHKEAFDHYLKLAADEWLNSSNYLQGLIALSLHRFGNEKEPAKIIKSLNEHAIHNEEMGMYWKSSRGYYWYQAPIETQALLIELYSEVANDQKAVNEMKIWLLKQKQTQNWETTKATTEAVYALLLQGTDWLANSRVASVKLGDVVVDPEQNKDLSAEAGTGYFKTSWSKGEITPEMGNIEVTNRNEGVAWGAVYWQYFENLDKITTHETPLKLMKQLFIVKQTDRGEVLEEITDKNQLKIGDKIKVRIELRSDRDMEYLHMKDMRASGFEPINVLSTYKYQDGLGYYEATGDAATNFFISYLPKGTYVFEYPLRVTHKGDFSNGITTIQCMYAPEFTSHSEGIRVEVK